MDGEDRLPAALQMHASMTAGRVYPRNLPALALACLIAAVLMGCGGTSGIPGLPEAEFNQAFAAGLDVAAAERCGTQVDAGLVRHNLVETVKRRGLSSNQAEKSGLAFDKTRNEYSAKLAKDPAYCVRAYADAQDRLARYQKGDFPDLP